VSRLETIACQKARDDIVLGDQRQCAHSVDDVRGGACTLASPTPR
jgi:hypothetical protein